MMQQNYALRKNFTAMTLAKRTRLCNITRRHERAGKRQKRRVEITKILVTVIRQVSSIPALRARDLRDALFISPRHPLGTNLRGISFRVLTSFR